MVNLGDEVRDTISGFRGVVVSKHYYLQGCCRVSVQPKVNKEGKLPGSETFDEPLLKLIEKGNLILDISQPGGPEKYMPKPKTIGKR